MCDADSLPAAQNRARRFAHDDWEKLDADWSLRRFEIRHSGGKLPVLSRLLASVVRCRPVHANGQPAHFTDAYTALMGYISNQVIMQLRK